MADHRVVGDVSATIVRTPTAVFQELQPAPLRVELNDLSDTVQVSTPVLTVFLYDIAEDPASRNQPPVRSLPPEQWGMLLVV